MRNYDDSETCSPKLCPEQGSPNITNYDTIIIIGTFFFLFQSIDEFLKLYNTNAVNSFLLEYV